ncbi:MAG: CRISPR-associated protein Cas5 [Armatimonadetes bacterium]|nr:CRISPR-associated protein Cas5 [Armatimonadota bacterium]MDW8154305.1 CRISPR-associated protein Cas5 [Armatimonadota bacterium]
MRVRAPVASFRRPLDHNYQRTLPMPPPTTLKGIAGAALGLSDRELWAPESPMRGLKISVWMDAKPGRARDLWTVLKIKNARIEARSPYFRELLFFTRYTLLYGGDAALLQKLKRAFRDPAYPLSLGREDELLLVEEVQLDEAKPGEPRLQGTLVVGDVRQMSNLRPILREGSVFEPPVVETLPLAFTVDAKGIRHPEPPVPVSFLPLGVEWELSGLSAWWWKDRAWVWIEKI